jgi:hypothetical protein
MRRGKTRTLEPMRNLILAIATTTSLTGCLASALGTLQISEPYLESSDSKNPLRGGVVLLDDISVAIVPVNYQRSSETAGPLIFPIIPVSADSRYERQGAHFRVIIEFETSPSGSMFNPKLVDLHIGSETLRPERTRGPYGGTYGTRTAWYRAIPGHSAWNCDHAITLLTDVDAAAPINGRICFAVEFPVETPPSSQQFSIRLEGLERNGTKVKVPTIHFRPSSATYMYRVT